MKNCKSPFGIIGGAGPLASALLYDSIVKKCYAQKIFHLPEIVIVNFPFTRALSLNESKENHEILRAEIQYCLNTLQKCGVSYAALCCNTLHGFLCGLDMHAIEFMHLPQSVARKIAQNKIRSILILGTQTTISEGLYKGHYPSKEEQGIVDSVIDRILQGFVLKEDSNFLSLLIKKVKLRFNIDAVVLGCTELPVLHSQHPISCQDVEIFDSIQILADTFITKFGELS